MRRLAIALSALAAGAVAESPARAGVSCGSANRGALARPAALSTRGWAHVIPAPWRGRNRRYGTSEMIGLLRRAAAVVARRYPGSLLGVADISAPRGGATGGHRSHQSGRDTDLLYYAIDRRRRVIGHDRYMPIYDQYGRATTARRPTAGRIPERFFDLARNWLLIKAMLTDRQATVQYIFVAPRIEAWLIAYARTIGESPRLVRRAAAVLSQTSHDMGHDDHMHVRIRCSESDIAWGRCTDANAPHRSSGPWRSRVACPVQRPGAHASR